VSLCGVREPLGQANFLGSASTDLSEDEANEQAPDLNVALAASSIPLLARIRQARATVSASLSGDTLVGWLGQTITANSRPSAALNEMDGQSDQVTARSRLLGLWPTG
jgi:hypothetical protein